jgi:hypothetical protein
MAQWQLKVDFKDIFDKYKSDEIGVVELSSSVAERLEKLIPEVETKFPDYLTELEDIVDCFRCLSEQGDADIDDFDDVLADLYDWADSPIYGDSVFGKKLCWVKTVF